MNHNNAEASPADNYLEALDYNLQKEIWNRDCLQHLAKQLRLPRPRSLAWAVMLKTLPLPGADFRESLATHRNFYNDLKKKLSMDPRGVIDDDPLSQNDESVWNQHFCDNELKALILQDVVRTFPDELYFRDKDVQDLMVRVLFFWARAHGTIGYRQGMHEVLAPLLAELRQDRQLAPPEPRLCDLLKEYLAEDCLEHDSYMLFTVVMRGLEKFYTTGDVIPSSCGRLPSSKVIHNPNEVVRYLERIREEHLLPLDGQLAEHLANCNISLELFGIRWLRLLFGREFPRSEIAHLWGFLFCDGPTLPNIHYVVLAILISMRSTLLEPDAGAVLAALMRPCPRGARHVAALARHLAQPLLHERPPSPPPPPPSQPSQRHDGSPDDWSLEELGVPGSADADAGSEGVPEGADVARELATLALLRAQLPPAAAALAAALPRPQHDVALPLNQILQLASLLQCRNHALVDVEPALEAAEAQPARAGRHHNSRRLVPVAILGGKRLPNAPKQQPRAIKEVPLQVFHQAECVLSNSDLPCLDPLRLRTE